MTRRTAKTFERGESVEIKGKWRGAPWRAAEYSKLDGITHIAIDNSGVAHYIPSRRIRKRKP